ncbi:MAG: peptidase C69 [Acidobacteria bacterium 13_1_20CM_3_53_8]|nr:MAG: peptidase C69 [Acidobacteria bacterium 13_1_20CM_3_53_8]
MALLTSQEAERILQKTLSFSKADEMQAQLFGNRQAYNRFGVNSASTSGDGENITLVINSHFGQKGGVATTNTLDDAGLERVVRAAEEIARLRPDNPEQMPFLGKQAFQDNPAAYDEATYNAGAETRTSGIGATIDGAKPKNLVAAGIYDNSGGFQAMANTKGLFGYSRQSLASYTTTVRTADGTGSGWASAMSHRISSIDAKAVGARAIDKAVLSQNPVAIEPGNYTVILEPNAVGDLVSFMFNFFDARQADEGRSFLSKRGGGNRAGEKFFGEQVNLYTDPYDPRLPGQPFDGDGLPNTKYDFVRSGVIKQLNYSRYWAKKQNVEVNPGPANLIMDGGNASIDDMIKSTERGVLVTRLWYIRLVDPQTVLLTGLTRDGTFLIEGGKIKSAIKNFRFNETPVKMLNNIDAMSPVVRITGSERVGEGFPILAPALKVRDFAFTSLSDAV